MSLRNQSIEILKNAVKNKTLGCYNKDVANCYYFHGETKTCCAVGAIIPKKDLYKNMDYNGNVNLVFKNAPYDTENNSIDKQLKDNARTYRGMKRGELIRLQSLHDNAILEIDDMAVKKENLIKFENYVNKLK